ncbi:hypothetical protein AOLI_G00192580 [Acnodon oligacanthus]
MDVEGNEDVWGCDGDVAGIEGLWVEERGRSFGSIQPGKMELNISRGLACRRRERKREGACVDIEESERLSDLEGLKIYPPVTL